MSQEKVDKRKYEKKHRKEIERKKKIKFTIKCTVAAVILGAAIGVPAGIKIYKSQPKFVGDSTLETYIANYIDNNYAQEISGLGSEETATDEAAETEDALTNAVEEAVGSDVEIVDEDNVDDILGEETDSSETEE